MPLDNEAGQQAFVDILGLNEQQVIVLKGYPDKIYELVKRGDILINQNETNEDKDEEQNISAEQEEKLSKEVEMQLKQIVSQLLKIKVERLNSNESLQDYGFDSIALKHFAEKIGRKYGIKVSPSLFFAHETIGKLSRYLIKEHKINLQSPIIKNVHTEKNKQKDGKDGKKADRQAEKKESRQVVANTMQIDYSLQTAIAVIGMEGVFPGAHNLKCFWQQLEAGNDLITEIPPERWNWKEIYGDPLKDNTKTLSKWGGFINDYDCFDAAFFKISEDEAKFMDPQHRLFLQIGWKAIEDAGYDPLALAGSN